MRVDEIMVLLYAMCTTQGGAKHEGRRGKDLSQAEGKEKDTDDRGAAAREGSGAATGGGRVGRGSGQQEKMN